MKISNILKLNISRKDLILALFLVFIVSLSQFILAKKHLEMGFFTDDWQFLSVYRAYVTNPFSDILQAWKQIGSHNFGYVYYIGILYNFFGLDYTAYRITNQILKIVATLSLYPLIFYISRRKLLAFLSTFIYAIHYSSFGLLDGPSRGGDYIAITLMNLFLLAYFYISKKVLNIFSLLGLAVWLFATILIGPTRLFPLLLVVPLIEVLNFVQHKTVSQIKISLKRLFVLYFPFLPLFLFSPESIAQQLRYSIGLFEKLGAGNWQLLFTPFAALGSTYIPKELWFLFGRPFYDNFGSYLSFLLFGPIFLYCVFFSLIGFFISSKPVKFIIRSLVLNFAVGILVFFIAHNWLFLNQTTRAAVDPGTFLVPALIGLFVMTTSLSLFIEWKESEKKNSLLPFLFLAPIFSLIFTVLTWLFADINSIFMGVHGYLTIPAIGTSIVLAATVVLIYEKIRSAKVFSRNRVIPMILVIVILGIYFKISATSLDEFFSHWLDNGLRLSDQQRIMDQFWKEVGPSRKFNQNNLPLVYLDTEKTRYEDGAFFAEAIVWKLATWFDLRYKNNKEGRFALCQVMILGKTELEKYVSVQDNETLISDKCDKGVYKKDNFFAFSLEDRNLVPERLEILKNLGVK